MKVYLLSLSVGVLVGAIYALLGVRSPAPPIVALVGLLGILVGEQLAPLAASLWKREISSSRTEYVVSHMFDDLRKSARPAHNAQVNDSPENEKQPGEFSG
ncbi:DUF1427 family protein [Sinorhizobium meliloti]|uniref:DUF1427 family protein n=1 Tax=Rhizobium meliloti TaxID=382 RepID=UPI001297CC52|nr:DUF1427 family protein [Sinorhizobium meliloti]MQX38710.1 DUF1427 family protein [Sinorhizobium meliloti]